MAESVFTGNCDIGLERVYDTEKENRRLSSDSTPRPKEPTCDFCDRPMSELSPFGDVSPYPGYGDARLLKIFRCGYPRVEEVESLMQEFYELREGGLNVKGAWKCLEQKYGREKVKDLSFKAQLSALTFKGWECRDCFCSQNEHFEKLVQQSQKEQ